MTAIDGTATTDTAERLRTAAERLHTALDAAMCPYDGGPLTSAEAGPIRLGCVELLEALGAHQQATQPTGSVPADERCRVVLGEPDGTQSYCDRPLPCDAHPQPEPNRHLREARHIFPGDVIKPFAISRWAEVVDRWPEGGDVLFVVEFEIGNRERLRFHRLARLHVSDRAADDGEPVANPARPQCLGGDAA